MKKRLAAFALTALFATSALHAQDIYILHDSGTQDSIAVIITDAGLNVEVGGPYWEFTNQDISEYSMVILLNGVAWTSAVPQAGQDNLRQYILNGGMMLSTEWISWSGSTNQTLNSIIPITYGGSWSTGSETYTVMAEHPITDDLPETFVVPSGWSFSVTNRKHDPTLNAITLIHGSRSRDALVIGDFGNGSIVHWNMGGHYAGKDIWSDEVRQILINIAQFIVPVSRVMLQNPLNHSEHIALVPEFSWMAVAGAENYRFQLSTDQDFSGLILDASFADNAPYIPAQALEPQSSYFWRVRATIDGTDGDWSRTWTFRTQTPTSADVTDAPVTFMLYGNYPNPFNPATTIRYDLPASSHVRLEVIDVLGRTLATLVDDERPAGIHEVRYDASLLAGGVYIYRIQAGGYTSSRPMLLLK
ncbi:MAG: T9SS C-terminal target domain-containing protein [Balneolaceae bacterium]|nr:MAG: T9SS C-terminal target domain-containing protein [Balneolaceae bacterium]